ncbi:MAG: YggS family pyridoxal phosphate-dependent enzyme [Victivallaceae bacterium]
MSELDMIQQKLALVRQAVGDCAEKFGRPRESVKLIAVSKFFPAADIAAACSAGQLDFGESKIQELTEKRQYFSSRPAGADICWHLIGHLQSNKVKNAVELADLIHSVDSFKLVEKLNQAAEAAGKQCKILLEFNISGETSKHGFFPEEARAAIACVLQAPHLKLCGLMTMAPEGADYQAQLAIFSSLRDLRDYFSGEFDISLPELSMGMSQDYEAAIASGATMVRIGSAIFGGRNYGRET